LRVWEQVGISGNLEVILPAGSKFTTATPVNLRGEKEGATIRIKNSKLVFDLQNYAPASYILL
jgi:alpha-mannosidase